MTNKEALKRLKQPFNATPDTDSYFDAKEVAIKSLEKDLSIVEELEKIKAKIQKENCTKCCLPHIIKECNNSKTGRDWCEYYVCLKAINENISELKGDNK